MRWLRPLIPYILVIIISYILLNVVVVSNPIIRTILYSIMALAVAYVVFRILVIAIFLMVILKFPK